MPHALNTVDELAVRLNSIEVSNIKKLLYASLKSAAIQLVTDLRTKGFDAITGQVDEYSIDKQTAFRDERYLSFKLSNGFVDTTSNEVVLVFGMTTDELDTATPLDSQYIKVDKEKGLVIIDIWGVNGAYMSVPTNRRPANFYQYRFRITYDCGFATKSIAEGKVYKGVPDWLFELSLLKAREVYHTTNPILSGDGKPLNAKGMSENIQPLLEANIRLFSLALTPII